MMHGQKNIKLRTRNYYRFQILCKFINTEEVRNESVGEWTNTAEFGVNLKTVA